MLRKLHKAIGGQDVKYFLKEIVGLDDCFFSVSVGGSDHVYHTNVERHPEEGGGISDSRVAICGRYGQVKRKRQEWKEEWLKMIAIASLLVPSLYHKQA